MDIDTRLAECDPARHVPLGGPESAEATRLYQRITRDAGPSRRRVGTRHRIAIGAVAGAAAAGLVAGVTLASLPSPASPGQAGPHAAATPPLELAAAIAARQPAGQVPGAGQFLYSKVLLSGVPGSAIPAGTATVQAWLTGDGHGRYAAHVCAPGCSTLAGEIPGAKSHGGNTVTTPFAVWGFPLVSPDSVASLPDSPGALMPVLKEYATHELPSYPGELGIVETAGSFLATAASPPVRAALYRLVEQLPGVRNLGRVTDKLGRSGSAVGFTSQGLEEELIYDPATSAVLETETVVAAPGGVHQALKPASVMRKLSPQQRAKLTLDWPHGEVLSTVVYAASGVVNSGTATNPAG